MIDALFVQSECAHPRPLTSVGKRVGARHGSVLVNGSLITIFERSVRKESFRRALVAMCREPGRFLPVVVFDSA